MSIHYNRRRKLELQLAEHQSAAGNIRDELAKQEATARELEGLLADTQAVIDATAAARQRLAGLRSSLSAQQSAEKSLQSETGRLQGEEAAAVKRLLSAPNPQQALETEAGGLAERLAHLERTIADSGKALAANRSAQARARERIDSLRSASMQKQKDREAYDGVGREFLAVLDRTRREGSHSVPTPGGGFILSASKQVLQRLAETRKESDEAKNKRIANADRGVQEAEAAVRDAADNASKSQTALERANHAANAASDQRTRADAARQALDDRARGRKPSSKIQTELEGVEKDIAAKRGGAGAGAGGGNVDATLLQLDEEGRQLARELSEAKATLGRLAEDKDIFQKRESHRVAGANAQASFDKLWRDYEADFVRHLPAFPNKARLSANYTEAAQAVKDALRAKEAQLPKAKAAAEKARDELDKARKAEMGAQSAVDAARNTQVTKLQRLQEKQEEARKLFFSIPAAAHTAIQLAASSLASEREAVSSSSSSSGAASAGSSSGKAGGRSAANAANAVRFSSDAFTFITQKGADYLTGRAGGGGGIRSSGFDDNPLYFSGASLDRSQSGGGDGGVREWGGQSSGFGAGAGAGSSSSSSSSAGASALGPSDAIADTKALDDLAKRLEGASKAAEQAVAEAQALPIAYGRILAELKELKDGRSSGGSGDDGCPCCGRAFAPDGELDSAIAFLERRRKEVKQGDASGSGAGASSPSSASSASLKQLRSASSAFQALSQVLGQAREQAREYATSSASNSELQANVRIYSDKVTEARGAVAAAEREEASVNEALHRLVLLRKAMDDVCRLCGETAKENAEAERLEVRGVKGDGMT